MWVALRSCCDIIETSLLEDCEPESLLQPLNPSFVGDAYFLSYSVDSRVFYTILGTLHWLDVN